MTLGNAHAVRASDNKNAHAVTTHGRKPEGTQRRLRCRRYRTLQFEREKSRNDDVHNAVSN